MTKINNSLPSMMRSFYHPHPRVKAMNEVTNPITGEVTSPPSRTKQSFKDECDINNILKMYKTTGMIRHINEAAQKGAYVDLPSDIDFQTALETVMRAEEAFATLPSKVRSRFSNDPQEFLEFVTDPRNAQEVIDLGLGTKPIVAAASAAPSSSSSSSSSPPSPSPSSSPPSTGGQNGSSGA